MSYLLDNSEIFTATNVTGTFTHDYNVSEADKVSFAVTCTPVSSGTGTLVLEASNDGVNFAAVPNTSTSISAAGTTIYSLVDPAYTIVRISYTAASAGMTLGCRVAASRFN